MLTLSLYKAISIALAIGLIGTSGATVYYYRQQGIQEQTILRSADLQDTYKDQISSLNSQIDSLNVQIAQLQTLNAQLGGNNAQLISQIQQLQTRVDQLEAQIDELQSQIDDLNAKLQAYNTLVSRGVLSLGGGTPLFVSFTVPSTASNLRINLTAYMSATPGGNQAQYFTVALLNQTEYELFQPWSDSPRTWSSPHVDSITALVDVPLSGNWYLAFENQTGVGSEQNVTYVVTLVITP